MIQLTKKIWLDSDEYNWAVGTRYMDNRNGKHYLKDPRFFSNVSNALAWVLDQDLKNCESLAEMFSRVEELRESLIAKTNFMQR
jgi:hypothetical protein